MNYHFKIVKNCDNNLLKIAIVVKKIIKFIFISKKLYKKNFFFNSKKCKKKIYKKKF